MVPSWPTFSRSVRPSHTAFAYTILILIYAAVRHVPAWFPGAGWKKAVAKYRETFLAMVEFPFKWVQEQMVSFYTLSVGKTGVPDVALAFG